MFKFMPMLYIYIIIDVISTLTMQLLCYPYMGSRFAPIKNMGSRFRPINNMGLRFTPIINMGISYVRAHKLTKIWVQKYGLKNMGIFVPIN